MTTQKKTFRSSVNVAPETAWRKSSYSSQDNGNCVEVAELPAHIGIRDSKDKQGPALVIPAEAWASFVGMVCTGDMDFGLFDA